jgi:hypothetical protein
MTTLQISIAALLAVCLGVCLVDDPRPAHASGADSDRPFHVVDSSGRVQLVVRNANDCAPWQPEPVWGSTPTYAPIGYRCFSGAREFRF